MTGLWVVSPERARWIFLSKQLQMYLSSVNRLKEQNNVHNNFISEIKINSRITNMVCMPKKLFYLSKIPYAKNTGN